LNKQYPARKTFAHPVAELHESVVQTKPSSQDCVVPTHCPDAHFFGSERIRSAQDAAWHWTPSVPLLHVVVLFDVVQIWHGFRGFTCPFAWHAPSIWQYPATRSFLQLVAVQESVVQAWPSLHDCVPPPPEHWPLTQVIGFVQVRLEQ
jgi:hypothetical protein